MLLSILKSRQEIGKIFYVPKTDMQSDDLKEIIGKNYNLEDDIIDRLEFTYKQKVDNKGKVRYL